MPIEYIPGTRVIDPGRSAGFGPTPPNTSIRDLGIQSGNPASVLSLNNTQSQNVAQSAPSSNSYQTFLVALQQMMKQYQTLGTAPFVNQELNASEAQNNRVLQETPSSLIGANPSLQAGARSASAGALQPTISGARSASQTFRESLNAFGDTVKATQDYFKSIEEQKNKDRDDARNVIKDAFAIGGADSLKGLNADEIKQLEKNAGYPTGYIEGVSKTLKERELELKRQNQINQGLLTESQKVTALNGIINQYNKSPLVAASDRTPVLKNAIANIRANPSNGAYQLNLAYAYIQALDTYQSAVREGELGLVNSIDSKIGQFSNYVSQIQNGQIVRPEVAKQLAEAAERVVDTINNAALQKSASFKSQATVAGVGDRWDQYISGFNASYQQSGKTKSNYEKIGNTSIQQAPKLFNKNIPGLTFD